MFKLQLPQDILNIENYSSLSTFQKSEYSNNLLTRILELNPTGVTISQVDNALKLGHSTIWHHLENLAGRAICLKIERGDTAEYSFNKVMNTLSDCHIQDKYYLYDFDTVENILGRFVRIQLKQENSSGNLAALSGVIVSAEYFGDFVNSLIQIRDIHSNRDKDREFFGEIINQSKIKEDHLNADKE